MKKKNFDCWGIIHVVISGILTAGVIGLGSWALNEHDQKMEMQRQIKDLQAQVEMMWGYSGWIDYNDYMLSMRVNPIYQRTQKPNYIK